MCIKTIRFSLLIFTVTASINLLAADKIIMTHGDVTVTVNDIKAMLLRVPEEYRSNMTSSEEQLKKMITSLMKNKLKAKKLEDDLSKYPLTEDEVRLLNISTKEAKSKLYESRIQESKRLPNFEKLAKEKYILNKNNYVVKADREISWIVIANNKENKIKMKKVYESIINKEKSFFDWAKEISKDKKSSALGGKLGKLSEYSFSKETVGEIESLIYPGQITKPLISRSKIVMFKLDRFIPERQKEFEEVKNMLTMNIKNSYVKRKLLELDQGLMRKEDLTVNDNVFLDIIENGIQ